MADSAAGGESRERPERHAAKGGKALLASGPSPPRSDQLIKLEDLRPNAAVRGLLPDSLVTVVNVQWFGSEAIELTYKTPTGKVANELVYRHDEPRLEIVEQGRPWS